MDDPRVIAGQLAHKFLKQGDATGWFEALYAGANWDEQIIPWENMQAYPGLLEWIQPHHE